MAEQANEHDQAFFLDLAKKGKEVWKEWRRLNHDVQVTFAGVDFSVTSLDHIKFEGFDFAHKADFSGATFGSEALFIGADFGDDANFKGATFRGKANFTDASFPERAHFDAAVFLGDAAFNGEKGFLTFSLDRARFYGEANFAGRPFNGDADFTNVRFYSPPNFDQVQGFNKIDFTNVYIGFGRPLHFHWTTDTKIPLRFRALRQIAEQTKNHDLERDLYIEERKAERGVYLRQLFGELWPASWAERPLIIWRLAGHVSWVMLMFAYWVLANYRRNFLLPIIWWLFLSLIIFPWWYGQVLEPLKQKAGPNKVAKYEQAIQMVSRGNAVPFVGPLTIDTEIKKFLFCPGFGECLPLPPKSYQWVVIFQNIGSIILVFFVGLAMRNYFKIR